VGGGEDAIWGNEGTTTKVPELTTASSELHGDLVGNILILGHIITANHSLLGIGVYLLEIFVHWRELRTLM